MQAVTRRLPVHISVTLNYPTPTSSTTERVPGLVWLVVGAQRSVILALAYRGGNARWTRWLIVILRGYSS